jgi:tRNA threonylcarbamoyladenosine biosynthesis protein TsaB
MSGELLSIAMPESLPLKTLSVDAASERISIALLEGYDVRAELRLSSAETRSARLLPSVAYLLRDLGWNLHDLDLIAAGIGPGSFTGIRIGVATALGLAQTLSIPFAGISCLDALAYAAALPEGRLGVVMDAQRSQVYYAEFAVKGRVLQQVLKPALLSPGDLGRTLRSAKLYLVGDGAILYGRQLGIRPGRWPRLLRPDLFLAASIGRLAMMRKRAWRSGCFLHAEPLYIRPPDALRTRRMKK